MVEDREGKVVEDREGSVVEDREGSVVPERLGSVVELRGFRPRLGNVVVDFPAASST